MLGITPSTQALRALLNGGNNRDNWKEGHTHAAERKLKAPEDTSQISFCGRLKHLTWAWFTLTMSTGGLALLLSATPHRFPGLTIIGKILYILNLVFFVSLVAGITARFIMTLSALKTSLTHPTESLFFPCFWLSTATILAGSCIYGVPSSGPWLPVALHVCFWIYVALSTLSAIVQFFILFKGAHLPIQSMTPAWILPIFPAMLVGTLAAVIAPLQPPEQRLPILVAGVSYLGLGLMVAFLIYPLYLRRLMQHGLPAPEMRPGMFIPVGQMGYTALALIRMSQTMPENSVYFAANPGAVTVLRTMALWIGIWIWMLGFWFLATSLIAVMEVVVEWRLRFSLSWWAFVFPNVGFAVATIEIGQEFGSQAVLWVSSAMTIALVVTWFVVLVAHVRAFLAKEIMWPGQD